MNTFSPLPLLDPDEGRRLCGGDASLYLRSLVRFALDPTAQHLEEALKAHDPSGAFVQAHTLKGLCAQLALPALGTAASQISSLLRAQDASALPQAEKLLPSLLALHEQTLQAIAQFSRGNS